jgi:hypothetical protein
MILLPAGQPLLQPQPLPIRLPLPLLLPLLLLLLLSSSWTSGVEAAGGDCMCKTFFFFLKGLSIKFRSKVKWHGLDNTFIRTKIADS